MAMHVSGVVAPSPPPLVPFLLSTLSDNDTWHRRGGGGSYMHEREGERVCLHSMIKEREEEEE